jgi:osmotically-inducible protein OsmY
MPTYPAGSQSSDLGNSRGWPSAEEPSNLDGAYGASQKISHRGKGPKGYRPSDARLAELICERLTDAPFIDARNVSIEVEDGEVTLTGSVEERRQKYAAEDVVADVFGVREVRNSLSVARYMDGD